MTQIRLSSATNLPGTHALIIGVGHYQHLLDGPKPVPGIHLGLSSLASPPISAMRLARWMLGSDGTGAGTGLQNPAAPLATVDVLVSSKQTEQLQVAGTTYPIESASLSSVQSAFDRWLDELKRHQGNVGVLYFCGHGVTGVGAEHVLLLDDYGATRNRPFQDGCFDIFNTLRALWRKVPAQLYMFIDACRTYDRSLGGMMGAVPGPLLQYGASSQNINRGTTWFESTGEGLAAYGDTSGTSRFTEALLQALTGYCGAPDGGSQNWLITCSALAQAVPALLAIVNKERGGTPQACSHHGSGTNAIPLHVTAQVPRVKVEIELSPEAQRTQRSFSIHDLLNPTTTPITGGRASGIWRTEALKGIYEVRIDSANPYVSGHKPFEPPYFYLPVEVQP